MNNWFSQQYTTNTPVTTAASGSTPVGYYAFLDESGVDDLFEVHPNYGIVGYSTISWLITSTSIVLNFKNTTSNPVSVQRDGSVIQSCRIYYDDVEQTKL